MVLPAQSTTPVNAPPSVASDGNSAAVSAVAGTVVVLRPRIEHPATRSLLIAWGGAVLYLGCAIAEALFPASFEALSVRTFFVFFSAALSLAVLALSFRDIFRQAWRDLLQVHLSSEICVAVGLLLGAVQACALVARGDLPEMGLLSVLSFPIVLFLVSLERWQHATWSDRQHYRGSQSQRDSHMVSALPGRSDGEHLESWCCFGLLFLSLSACIFWHERGADPVLLLSVASSLMLSGLLFAHVRQLPLLSNLLHSRLAAGKCRVARSASLATLDAARRVVIDLDPRNPPGEITITSFRLIDERVDRAQFVPILHSMLKRSDEILHRLAAVYLEQENSELVTHEFETFHSYAGQGICGNIQGVEISIGNERFLIDRGVQLAASDLDPSARILVALEDELVALFEADAPFVRDGREMVKELEQLGIRVHLCSRFDVPNLDEIGKSIGLELPDIRGGLSVEDYRHKLTQLRPALFYVSEELEFLPPGPHTALVLAKRAEIERGEEPPSEVDVAISSRDMRCVSAMLKTVKGYRSLKRQNWLFGILAGLNLLMLTFLGLLSPVVALLTMNLITVTLYLNTSRIVEPRFSSN